MLTGDGARFLVKILMSPIFVKNGPKCPPSLQKKKCLMFFNICFHALLRTKKMNTFLCSTNSLL